MQSEIIHGNTLAVLPTLREGSFHLAVTSPPYYQLRDYGTPPVRWPAASYAPMPGLPLIHVPAWEGECGQEPTIELFIGHMVLIFREVMRVLRDDGVLFVNLGETFAKRGGKGDKPQGEFSRRAADREKVRTRARNDVPPPFVKAKDRMGICERFVLALQADGWHYRDQVVWHKPSPMPESTSDRCTRAHELVFMFSKGPEYFYDAYAIREQSAGTTHPRGKGSTPKSEAAGRGKIMANSDYISAIGDVMLDRNPRSVWTLSAEPTKIKHFACWPRKLVRKLVAVGTPAVGCCPDCGAPFARVTRKKRVPTRPGQRSKVYYPAGWAPGGAKDAVSHSAARARTKTDDAASPYKQHDGSIVGNRDPLRHVTMIRSLGWRPTCLCPRWAGLPCCKHCSATGRVEWKDRKTGLVPLGADGRPRTRRCPRCRGSLRFAPKGFAMLAQLVPARVLDPFGGAATTNLVCEHMHRSVTCVELSAEYVAAGKDRLRSDRLADSGPLFMKETG
jgi:DNA modification methylase